MQDRIPRSVYLVHGREFYYVQYIDPWTKKTVTRSTKKRDKRAAERWAEQHLLGVMMSGPKHAAVSWAKLCEEYKADVFPAQALKTKLKTRTAMDAVATILDPQCVRSISTADIRRLKKAVFETGAGTYSVAGYLASLRKILRWGQRNGYLDSLPHFEMPKLTEPNNRTPRDEDFESMMKKTASVVGDDAAPSWRYMLEGLWLSGLRVSEAEVIQWTDGGFAKMWVDIDREFPLFIISAAFDKKRRRREFAMAPDFAEFLRKTPKSERSGHIFNPEPWGESPMGMRPPEDRIIKTISAIGAAAGVVVAERTPKKLKKKGEMSSPVKYASAHDCRRAFITRWANRVLPPALMDMARHDSMQTTMRYYVGRNAESAARQAWDAYRKGRAGESNGHGTN